MIVNDVRNGGYTYASNFIDQNKCKELVDVIQNYVKNNETKVDLNCPLSKTVYGTPEFDQFLVDCLPKMEEISGLELIPTYSYARLYAPNEELKIHVDREACEISATITLGFEGDCWPICFGDDKNKANAKQIIINTGDAVVYKGCDNWHWREKYTEGKWQAQVFIHYVDKNGPYADHKYDKRPTLGDWGNGKKVEPTLDICYTLKSAITEQFCDNLINTYSKDEVKKELPYIGTDAETVDYNIRNVKRVELPESTGIGGTLTAIGLNTNHKFWKFEVTHSNQTEFLMYEVGGKYEEHTDTFFDHSDETRKLTVLAILNDDYEGGKFYVRNGKDKIYPPQSKGDVIVFPSFIMHGVEPVTKGQRFTAVTWLVGKFFK